MRPRTLTHDFTEGWLPMRDTGPLHLKGDRIMAKTASDGMIQECSEERAALDKVPHFLKGAAKAGVVIPIDAAEDRACIAEYPHRHWLIAEVLTGEAWQEAKVNLRFNGYSLAFAGIQALDAEQAETISRTTSAKKAKPGDLLITIDCRRCIEGDEEVYDVLDSLTRSNTTD